MRLCAHSKRLAVSLLLGAMLVVLPMAQTAQAASPTPDPLLTNYLSTVPSSDQNICYASLSNSLMSVNSALVPAQFERIDAKGSNKLVITAPKDSLATSFTPVETVLKKVTSDDTQSDIVITPSPEPQASSTELPQTPATDVSPLPSTPSSNGSVMNADVLFNLVNNYRVQLGLVPFEKSDQICAVAASRAPEIDSEIWVTHTMHAGFYARNLPFWATENLISMQSEQAALNWWINSPVHHAALVGNYKYACVACSGKSCSMIFSNLEPKYVASSSQLVTPTPVAGGAPL